MSVGRELASESRGPASSSRSSIRFIRDYEYRGLMEEADREVLEFIGDQGKTAEQVSDRFPAFDLERLVRAELARPRRTNPVKSTTVSSLGRLVRDQRTRPLPCRPPRLAALPTRPLSDRRSVRAAASSP